MLWARVVTATECSGPELGAAITATAMSVSQARSSQQEALQSGSSLGHKVIFDMPDILNNALKILYCFPVFNKEITE